MTARILIFALALGTGALSAAAQGPPPPPPPPMPQSQVPAVKGSASLKGTVRSAATGKPLRRAQVRISAVEMGPPRSTSTDLTGAYEFTELPPGRYTINVTRSGHLATQHGQKRYGEPGSPLQIAEGEYAAKIDFSLERASTITGRITDEVGEPISGVAVYPMRQLFFQGRRSLVPVSASGRTDDTGQYRLVGIPPGDYVVMGSIRETWVSDEDAKVTFAFGPSYYPGTSRGAEAQHVKVGAGQEVSSIDFQMVPGRAVRVSGTATAFDGTPLSGASVLLTQQVLGPGGGSMSMGGQARVAPDGTFSFKDVSPGDYRLSVTRNERDRPPETAGAILEVTGSDVNGVALVTDPGGVIAGRLVAEGGGTLPKAVAPLRVTTLPAVPAPMGSTVRVPDGEDDGVVSTEGVFSRLSPSGPAFLRVAPLPAGWAIKSVEVDGRDHADLPITVSGGRRLEGVKVTISNRFPSVSGRLSDDKGAPVQGTVLLFPSDAAKWMEAGGATRTARPDQSGLYRFDTVRPGEYLVAAVDYVQQWSVNDPEFLESLRGDATAVRLTDAEAETVNLKVKK